MRAMSLSGYDDCARHLSANPQERELLAGLCRIPISRFYGDKAAFDATGQRVSGCRDHGKYAVVRRLSEWRGVPASRI